MSLEKRGAWSPQVLHAAVGAPGVAPEVTEMIAEREVASGAVTRLSSGGHTYYVDAPLADVIDFLGAEVRVEGDPAVEHLRKFATTRLRVSRLDLGETEAGR
jgi:hypothetical protein